MSTGMSCADLLKHHTNHYLLQTHLVRSVEMVNILKVSGNYT